MGTLIKDKYEWVKEALTSDPRLRDSNERLYYVYLRAIGYDTKTSLENALRDMHLRKIPYLDSIGRASRKVQEEHPELRGKNYKQRKSRQTEVADEIRPM